MIVIGGGAAGFFGAITCAEQGVKDVLILEKGSEVLTKVRISGGGRCNVTHACFDPRDLVESYPRGEKALLGPFFHWQPGDTIDWFARHGVELKTEADGRMFPVTDDSRTIVEALERAAREHGVTWRTKCGVRRVERDAGGRFKVETDSREDLEADFLLVATGGIRSKAARQPLEDLGHEVEPPVPSLFTFHIEDERIEGLQGLSVEGARVSAAGRQAEGPVLVTHWGLSGPAVLKLSARGARDLAARDYRFELGVDWSGGRSADELSEHFQVERSRHGARRVASRSVVDGVPRRLWERLVAAAGIPEEARWAQLTREQAQALVDQVCACRFQVQGKSLNKDEFVTCGGVRLQDVDFRTMESRLVPGLYFAGEVLDIDGVTGGFNFQSAWTTGRLAGEAMAASLLEEPS